MKNFKKLSLFIVTVTSMLLSGCNNAKSKDITNKPCYDYTERTAYSCLEPDFSTNTSSSITPFSFEDNGKACRIYKYEFNGYIEEETSFVLNEHHRTYKLLNTKDGGGISTNYSSIVPYRFSDQLMSLYAYDVNEDGFRDFCMCFYNGMGRYITIYDFKNEKEIFYLDETASFTHGNYNLVLETNEVDSNLSVYRNDDNDKPYNTTESGEFHYSESRGVYLIWNNYFEKKDYTLSTSGNRPDTLSGEGDSYNLNLFMSWTVETNYTGHFTLRVTPTEEWVMIKSSEIHLLFRSRGFKVRTESVIGFEDNTVDIPLLFERTDESHTGPVKSERVMLEFVVGGVSKIINTSVQYSK